MEKKSFINWLFSETSKSSKIISLFSLSSWLIPIILFLYNHLTLSLTTSEFDNILKSPEGSNYRKLLLLLHMISCFILAVATPKPHKEANNYITEKASNRIHKMVISLYCSLGILYLVLTFFVFGAPTELPETDNLMIRWHTASMAWESSFEILTATLIFFLYVELSDITVETGKTGKNLDINENPQSHAQRDRIIFVWFAIALFVLNILSYFFPQEFVQGFVKIIVACLSGVTLSMVIGRLGSLYINPGTATLFFLYLYAVIQPFAAFFPSPTFLFIATSIALPLKILLWLVFVWAFTSGKLWEYIQEIRQILEEQKN